MSWNLEELRTNVDARFGREQREALGIALESIISRFKHAHYHIDEFKSLEQATLDGRTSLDLFEEMVSFEDARVSKFSLRASAHATAAVLALHAVSDITGGVIKLSLHQGVSWNGSLAKVSSSIPPNCGKLKTLIDALCTDENYSYLCAVANQSKHRNVVTTKLVVDMTGAESNRYEFISFDRYGKVHLARKSKVFLETEWTRQANAVIGIGKELNTVALGL